MATAKQETAKGTPKVLPTLAGKAMATRHAGALLRASGNVRESAHGILRDTGMVSDLMDESGKVTGEAWKGFPEGFGSFLAIAKVITPQPLPKGPTVLYVEPRKRPGCTERELRFSKDVHTVADALTKVSVDYGRPEGTSKGTRSAQPEGKANGSKGKGASVKMSAATARSVAKALTDKGTPAATVKAFRASIAEQITILAARGVKDDALLSACQAYVKACGGLESKAPTPATVKASRPNMPGSQVT